MRAVVTAVRARGAAVGMDDIAAESGVAKPVFYRYFADKADLFAAVGRMVAEEIVTDIGAALDWETAPRAMLTVGIDAYLRHIEAEPELYRFVVSAPLDRTTADPVTVYSDVIGLRLTRLIGARMRDAGLDAAVAEPWGFGIVGMVRAAGERWLDQQSMSREALTEYLSRLLWSGFAGVRAGVPENVAEKVAGSAPVVPLGLVPDVPAPPDEAAGPDVDRGGDAGVTPTGTA